MPPLEQYSPHGVPSTASEWLAESTVEPRASSLPRSPLRLLLVAFYFPPAGGGGVQRPLKLAGHLAELGVDVHVLAPDDPRWIHRDEELEIPGRVKVHRARYLGPRGRRPAEELFGRTGLDRLARQLALTPRRLLVPDEHALWLLNAIPAALRTVRREQIDVVLTTSPPSSVHLVGAAVQLATGVRWIADLRDSLVAKPDLRFERRAVRLKAHTHRQVATMVAHRADDVVAVTGEIAEEIRRLNPRARVALVPNGMDREDFDGLVYRRADRFRLTHTGSFFGRRDPRPLLEALRAPGIEAVARFVGDFRAADYEWAREQQLGDRLELHPFAAHRRALELQRDTEALLLLLPNGDARDQDVPSGKLYEYLAAERPILAAVPPNGTAARLIRESNSGVVVEPDDVDGIVEALGDLERRWREGTLEAPSLSPALASELSRLARAHELLRVLDGPR